MLSWLALGLVAACLLWALAPVLTPFLIAAMLAYVLRPAVDGLTKRRLPRWLAVLIVETAFCIAVIALLLLLLPIAYKQLPLLRDQMPQLADRFIENLARWLAPFGVRLAPDVAGLKDLAMRMFDVKNSSWITTALNSVRIGGSAALTLVGNAVLVPVALFYLLLDWSRLVRRQHELVPPRMRTQVEDFLAECDTVLGQYLRGQLLVMVILAMYYSIALTLAGFDLGLPLGLLTGFAIFVPYVGFGLGLLLSLLAAVLQFGNLYGLMAVAVVYGFGQVLEGFFLTPRLVGERIGLSPLAVIFALLAFGHIFGFVGVLVALPVSAVLAVAARRMRAAYLTSALYGG